MKLALLAVTLTVILTGCSGDGELTHSVEATIFRIDGGEEWTDSDKGCKLEAVDHLVRGQEATGVVRGGGDLTLTGPRLQLLREADFVRIENLGTTGWRLTVTGTRGGTEFAFIPEEVGEYQLNCATGLISVTDTLEVREP